MRALVLSGGGAKGAYQCGAISALRGCGASWDILSGVSVGAINAAYLCQHLDHYGLRNLWESIDDDDVKGRWFFGWFSGLFKGGLYNMKPLRKLLEDNLDLLAIQRSGRKLRLGAVSLTSGEYRLWDEMADDLIDGVLASAAHPVGLAPIKARGEVWTDGGVRNVTPLRSAIKAGATEIDVVMCAAEGGPGPWKPKCPRLLHRSIRELEILLDEASSDDLRTTEWINQAVRSSPTLFGKSNRPKREIKLRIIRPKTPLDIDSLDFDPEKIRVGIERGYRDALSVLTHGGGGSR
jgi:NTE family protein